MHLVDRQANKVIALSKVKSIEYLIFKSMLENLNGGIERGEIDTKFDQVMQSYVKEHRAILKICPSD